MLHTKTRQHGRGKTKPRLLTYIKNSHTPSNPVCSITKTPLDFWLFGPRLFQTSAAHFVKGEIISRRLHRPGSLEPPHKNACNFHKMKASYIYANTHRHYPAARSSKNNLTGKRDALEILSAMPQRTQCVASKKSQRNRTLQSIERSTPNDTPRFGTEYRPQTRSCDRKEKSRCPAAPGSLPVPLTPAQQS